MKKILPFNRIVLFLMAIIWLSGYSLSAQWISRGRTNYILDNLIADGKASNPKLYYLGCGKTDFLYSGVTDLRALYDEVGFRHTYRESEGGHSWNNWRLYLSEMAQQIFK